MRNTTIFPLKNAINARISEIAADKSISHRSVIFSFLSNKESRIKNYLLGEDTLNTLKIAKQLGARVKQTDSEILISPNKNGIIEPDDILDCGNAGTAIRLYLGLLSTRKGQFILSGDKYLRARPMSRIIKPLRDIGAQITARSLNGKEHELAPICVNGASLNPFHFHSHISSAQVKTAMILAGLNIDGISEFSEVSKSRDHSERMLNGMGADLKIDSNKITIFPSEKPLDSLDIEIPADPSSAFYFAVLALISKNAHIVLENVLLNETRIEAFVVLQKMGANIKINKTDSKYEDIGTIEIQTSELNAIEIGENISWLIDEIPALAVACAFAKGESKIINAKELRFKESDRIKATINGLRAFGVKCEELDDGFIINGGANPVNKGIKINSYGDHRIAMSFAIMGAVFGAEIEDSGCIDVSFPNFLNILGKFLKIESKEI